MRRQKACDLHNGSRHRSEDLDDEEDQKEEGKDKMSSLL